MDSDKVGAEEKKFRWSESLVIKAVADSHYQQPWLVLPKFRPGTGTGTWSEKEFDCFCFHPWPSMMFQRHVIEAKISRSDFLKEVKDPLKKRSGLYCSNYFWFAAPPGVVRNLEEVPPNCGYYQVGRGPGGSLVSKVVIPAPELCDEPPTWNFLAAAVRRVLGDEYLGELRQKIQDMEGKLETSSEDITHTPATTSNNKPTQSRLDAALEGLLFRRNKAERRG